MPAEVLKEELYMRVGELMSHLGRYDMHALLLQNSLTPGISIAQSSLYTAKTRGSAICRIMVDCNIPTSVQVEFQKIDQAFSTILARHEISSKAGAVVDRLTLSPVRQVPVICAPRDWYDHAGVSESEILAFIQNMEEDIIQLVSLYLRLAALTQNVRAGISTRPKSEEQKDGLVEHLKHAFDPFKNVILTTSQKD